MGIVGRCNLHPPMPYTHLVGLLWSAPYSNYETKRPEKKDEQVIRCAKPRLVGAGGLSAPCQLNGLMRAGWDGQGCEAQHSRWDPAHAI